MKLLPSDCQIRQAMMSWLSTHSQWYQECHEFIHARENVKCEKVKTPRIANMLQIIFGSLAYLGPKIGENMAFTGLGTSFGNLRITLVTV